MSNWMNGLDYPTKKFVSLYVQSYAMNELQYWLVNDRDPTVLRRLQRPSAYNV